MLTDPRMLLCGGVHRKLDLAGSRCLIIFQVAHACTVYADDIKPRWPCCCNIISPREHCTADTEWKSNLKRSTQECRRQSQRMEHLHYSSAEAITMQGWKPGVGRQSVTRRAEMQMQFNLEKLSVWNLTPAKPLVNSQIWMSLTNWSPDVLSTLSCGLVLLRGDAKDQTCLPARAERDVHFKGWWSYLFAMVLWNTLRVACPQHSMFTLGTVSLSEPIVFQDVRENMKVCQPSWKKNTSRLIVLLNCPWSWKVAFFWLLLPETKLQRLVCIRGEEWLQW